MVSDEKLVNRLREFLSTSDLNTMTIACLRRQLEKDFGIDLSGRRAFIREQVDLYLEQVRSQNEEGQPAEDMKPEENDGAEESQAEADEESDETQEEDGDEESNKTGNGKIAAKKRKQSDEVKRRGNGFTKPCSLSPQLQKFIGESQMPRTQVVKQLWNYIRENNLQNPSNKRKINCDDTLRELFKVDSIDMFQMNKALSKHIWPLDSDGANVSASSTPKEKKRKKESDEESDEPKGGEKRKKTGIQTPCQLSDGLKEFLGTGESELPRPSVIKRIWDHIKQNNLQDPSDRRKIICDDKLKKLFEVDTFVGFGVAKLLKDHFIT
ncbi:hypothetical protein DM860_005009 [Cuscuta australis]|uniref:DM2 domain-containing protein n=1 Tax=Cuscuta australis TaxID=267555 RepID=A0A328DN93_9ASTE|nr:hypothetical protein DM860_005009 [Cuscuta australis]